MTMVSDPERFSKIASGIQSIVVAGALLVGGGWTLYTFNSQLQVENARGQLQKLSQELSREPKLEINVSVSQVAVGAKKRRHLFGDIAVSNVGNTTTALVLDDRPIELFKVGFDSSGETNWQLIHKINSRTGPAATLGVLISHAGAKNVITFATFVDQPGLYVIRFEVERSKEEQERARTAGAFEKYGDSPAKWGREHYFIVN